MRPVIPAIVFALISLAPPATAATLTVTSLLDDGSPGTLRSQLAAASPGDRIEFAVTGSIVLSSSLVISTSDLTITGPGRDVLTLDGGGVDRVVEVTAAATGVEIRDVSIKNGNVEGVGDGGGVLNAGGLTLRHVEVSWNGADSGAGIHTTGNLSLYDVLIESNRAGWLVNDYFGGGLSNASGTVTGAKVTIRAQNTRSPFAFATGMALANVGGEVDLAVLAVDDGAEQSVIANVGGEMRLSRSTLVGGCMIVANTGSLAIDASELTGGSCDGSAGLTSSGTLRLTDVDFHDFHGTGNAGLFLSGSTVIERSTIRNTSANVTAGVENSGDLLVLNSTISNNIGLFDASGFENKASGTARLFNSTIAGSPAPFYGTAVVINRGGVIVRNSLIHKPPILLLPACAQMPLSYIVDLDGRSLAADVSCDPIEAQYLALAPLADNGGPTLTHALLPGSPALDRATNCTYDDDMDDLTPEVPVQKDQRGMLRFGGAACDVGAFEDEAVPVPVSPAPIRQILTLALMVLGTRALHGPPHHSTEM